MKKKSDVGKRYMVIKIESQTCYSKTNKMEMTNFIFFNLVYINFTDEHKKNCTLSMSSSTEQ